VRDRIKTILRWSNLILIIVTLLAYLSPYLHPRIYWVVSLLGLFYPLLLVLNVVCILFWISLRKWYFLFSLGGIIIGWNFLSKSVGVNINKSDILSNTFTFATFNTESAHAFWDKKAGRTDYQKFSNYLQSLEADILCLQEFPVRGELNLMRSTKLMHSYQATGKSIITYSKFPIVKQGYFAFVNEYNGCVFTDVKVENRIVRVYNLHLCSNKITNIANQVAKEGDWDEKETWRKVKDMLVGYRSAARIRSDQAEEIAKHIAGSPYPVLVCGDFNDVPLSYAYNAVANKLTDYFQEEGKGLGTTFSGSIPFLKIDYLLGSSSIQAQEIDILHHDYSDHYPVRAVIALNQE